MHRILINKRLLLWAVPLLLIITLYIVVSAIKLRYPGTQYDEALYVNAALGGVDKTTFITKSFHGFPILLMPYIGALKAWIFYPIFAVFGVSPITMRLPSILLTAIGLFGLYYLLRSQVGRRLSVLIVAVTALDASFIMFTRLDEGPVVLDLLLKIIGLTFLLRFARQRRLPWLVGFWACMLLGTFDKLNFIWNVNAIVAAFVLLYGRSLWRSTKQSRDRLYILLISAVGYLLCVAYYLYISKTYHLVSSFGFVGWTMSYNLFSSLVDGNWFYNYALSINKVGSSAFFWFVMAVVIAGALFYAWKIQHKKALPSYARFYGLILVTFVLLLGQIVMTRQATAGWHYFSLYPFVGILFVLTLDSVMQTVSPKRRKIAVAIPAIVVGLVCIYQLGVYYQYIKLYGKPVNNFGWSATIYSLSDFAKAHPHSQFVSLDWGTQTQLMGFDPIPNKYYEVFGPIPLQDQVAADTDFREFVTQLPNAYYITHPASRTVFPEVSRDFFKLADEHGYQPVVAARFNDGPTTNFVVYQLQRP